MRPIFPIIRAPADLEQRINGRIAQAEKRQSIWRFSYGVAGGALSFAGMIVSVRAIATTLHQSGFFSYFSVLLSDGANYWKDISLSLLDSLPILGIAAFLAVLTAFLFASAEAARSFRRVFA